MSNMAVSEDEGGTTALRAAPTRGKKPRREVFRSGPHRRAYAQGARIGDTIHVAGQVATNEDGSVIGEGDLEAQVRQVYANAGAVLSHFGAGLDDVAAETWYVTDMADFAQSARSIFEIRRELYNGDPPVAQTVVQVVALYRPELLVEVQFTASLAGPTR
jgi:enamine deaminase RidA (YjgF/YER057c/UK114 family)